MAIFADCAPADAHARGGPSPWLAALLTVLTPGLGHLYIGQARRGIILFVLVMIADTLLMFAMMGVLARFWMCAASLILLIGLWLYIVFDAVTRARRTPPSALQRQNRWTLYVAACRACLHRFRRPVLLCLAGEGVRPALGQVGELEHGANARSRRSSSRRCHLLPMAEQPMRGEVAVYRHPQAIGPSLHQTHCCELRAIGLRRRLAAP